MIVHCYILCHITSIARYESLALKEIRKSRLLIDDAFEICDSFVYVVMSRRSWCITAIPNRPTLTPHVRNRVIISGGQSWLVVGTPVSSPEWDCRATLNRPNVNFRHYAIVCLFVCVRVVYCVISLGQWEELPARPRGYVIGNYSERSIWFHLRLSS